MKKKYISLLSLPSLSLSPGRIKIAMFHHLNPPPSLYLKPPPPLSTQRRSQAMLSHRKSLQEQMGLSSDAQSHHKTHKLFLISNYILLGAASSCIILTLSLRLFPSIAGGLLVLLHIITIAGAISGCNAVSAGSNKWYAFHMVATVLTAIFQGSVSSRKPITSHRRSNMIIDQRRSPFLRLHHSKPPKTSSN